VKGEEGVLGKACLGLAVSLVLLASPAAADVTKAQCVDANTSAQTHRRDGKLSQARDELRLCGDPHCPRVVRDDCTRRIDEIELVQPTIVFDVKDPAGGDIGDVKVSVDERKLTEKLDGSALAIDPGEHTFTFQVEGQPSVALTIVVKEGEKSRRVSVVVGAAPPPPEPPPAKPEPAPSPPLPSGLGPFKTTGLVLGGVGVGGLALGAAFGIIASSKWSRSKNECGTATSCTNYTQAVSDHDSAVTSGTVSTIAFAAGGAMIALGGVLFFTAKPASAPSPATGIVLSPGAGPCAAGFPMAGRF
jgi:hypothetical protein